MAATELEYYLYRSSYRDAATRDFRDLEPAGWYLEDYHLLQGTRTEDYTAEVRRHLNRSGVPVESSKGEWGVGQHELNIRYAEILEMADRHVIYKQCLKEMADRMGASVTFMAKIAADQAGSSCHIHMSLWRDGVNAFAGDQELGPVRCSDEFRWFLGGCLAHASRDHGVLRADGELVQALRRRLVGADTAGVELRQPHRRASRGRARAEPAHRVPRPRRRLQPVPRAGRHARVGPRRHRRRRSSRRSGSSATCTRRSRCRTCPARSRRRPSCSSPARSPRRAFGEQVVEHYGHFFRTE